MTERKTFFLFLFLVTFLTSFFLNPNEETIENPEAVKGKVTVLEREKEEYIKPEETPIAFENDIEDVPVFAIEYSQEEARIQEGEASWYGGKFHGRTTASGEKYNMYELTAAHKEFEFGTVVRVIHSRNGRYVNVRINDRGPFIKGRIIDLSMQAAREIGMKDEGIADVKVKIIESP